MLHGWRTHPRSVPDAIVSCNCGKDGPRTLGDGRATEAQFEV